MKVHDFFLNLGVFIREIMLFIGKPIGRSTVYQGVTSARGVRNIQIELRVLVRHELIGAHTKGE